MYVYYLELIQFFDRIQLLSCYSKTRMIDDDDGDDAQLSAPNQRQHELGGRNPRSRHL